MIKFIAVILFFFISFEIQAEESLLTLKQQLDRLQREVSDISQLVFKGSRDQAPKDKDNGKLSSNLTAFDLRIYDLEKDIKILNENFEELIFQIDDLKKIYENIIDIDKVKKNSENSIDNLQKESEVIASMDDSKSLQSNKLTDENTLGTLVINSEDLSSVTKLEDSKKIEDPKKNALKEKSKNLTALSPEEEFQKAFDMIRNQQFSEAKIALQNFIEKYKDNKLVGSAHYWLGEIYLLKKEYREAALILAEGYQKFPLSFKAPNMLLKLSESLINIGKKNDACGTLDKLIQDFPKHKLAYNAQNKLNSLKCNIVSE